MPPAAAIYKCSGRDRGVCFYEASAPWRGRCPSCGGFYSPKKSGGGGGGGMKTLASIAARTPPARIVTGIRGFDYVIGGGIVPGSVILLSGEEGTGKSSLLTAVSQAVAESSVKRTVVYASGEQSEDDLGLIAARLGCTSERVFPKGNASNIVKLFEEAEEEKPTLMIIDSVQTMFYEGSKKADVGSNEMGREVVNYATSAAKELGIAVILVSHVNKENEIAGTKAVVHLVDAVIRLDRYFQYDENDEPTVESKNLRVLSSGKNRYGEEGLEEYFKMTEHGLVPWAARLVLVD